ncbi:unnamed protein product, partial [Musa banksii]
TERKAGRRVAGGCLLCTLAWRTWRSRKAQGPMGESIKATPKREEQVRAVEDLGLLNIATVQDSNEAYHVMCQPSRKAHHISNATCSSTKEDTLNPVHHQERDKAHQPVDKAVPNGLHLSWLVEGFFCTSLLNSSVWQLITGTTES